MEYRRFGRTGLQVSLLGIGGGYLCLLEEEEGRRLYRCALELGITYFDGRYGGSSAMLRPLVQHDRERLVLGTKTAETTAEGALGRIEEDLRELGTDYIDVFYLRTYSREMLNQHLAAGGSAEGVLQAKERGKVRALGLSGHSDLRVLADGIATGLIDACLFPLNIVRREGLRELVPVAQRHDVGLAVMKPLSVGMVPPELGLPWLANQPIHTMAPGVSNLAQLEADAHALDRPSLALSVAEEAAIEGWRRSLETRTCRICDQLCQPLCEAKLPIDMLLYHDVFYNQYRALGLAGFLEAPLASWARAGAEDHFARALAQVRACTRCGRCEEACPYHLPVREMLDRLAADCAVLIEALRGTGWKERYAEAAAPWQASRQGRRFLN